MKEFNKEIKNWTYEIENDPYNSYAFYKRGFTYFSAGKLSEAIEDFTMAIKIDPKDQWAYAYRGLAKHASGNKDGAIADWETASNMGNELARGALLRYCK